MSKLLQPKDKVVTFLKKLLYIFSYVEAFPGSRGTHKCIKEGHKRDGPQEKSVAALKTVKAAWLKQPQGMDLSSVRRLFNIAERAVKGLPLQK